MCVSFSPPPNTHPRRGKAAPPAAAAAAAAAGTVKRRITLVRHKHIPLSHPAIPDTPTEAAVIKNPQHSAPPCLSLTPEHCHHHYHHHHRLTGSHLCTAI
ncbi:hypothetical protein E2C01_069023 [Portunus trituberculatus]|uniref:Uncharacterized protein n=1 Tax=Portunus trituberculatus TaxID=210409 RepID=A0A5B7HXH8_PORTR|nr:hypothetical protein [Portunus trituberculatus]